MKEFQKKQKELIVKNVVRALKWFFGWLPRGQLKKIDDVEALVLESDDDDEPQEN